MRTLLAQLLICGAHRPTAAAPAGGPVPSSVPPPHSHRHHAHLLHHEDLPASHLPVAAWARAEPFPLNSTRLTKGSVYSEAQEANSVYLHYLDADRLLYQFRHFAGLPNVNSTGAQVQPYGGWESPLYVEGLINGHFTGHLLSALAFDAAGTGDPATAAKGRYLVAELAKCQSAIAAARPEMAGWVSAYGIDHLERLEAHNTTQVWAPYYTLHKLMAGLLDQWEQQHNAQAMAVLQSLAAYLHKRISTLKAAKGEAWWQMCLATEFGGMNELGYNLYAHTKNPDHRTLGGWFYKQVFMDPLAAGRDSLNGNHANCHLPEVVGVARGWEVTGNDTLANITATFHAILGSKYSYATGGSNVNEHWSSPEQLGDSIATEFDSSSGAPKNSNGFHTEETCTQYNSLKMLRHLFRWAPAAAIADDYERKLTNGILGVQQPGVVGSLSYMTPLGRGVNRNQWDWWGFGSKDNSFWCCYGTTIESYAKLGDSIYFRSVDAAQQHPPAATASTRGSAAVAAGRTLYVAQYIPSVLSWPETGLQLTMTTKLSVNPLNDPKVGAGTSASLQVNLTIGALDAAVAAPSLSIRIRVPEWAAPGSGLTSSRPGGGPSAAPIEVATVSPSTFHTIQPPGGGVWKAGDHVSASWTMVPKLIPINDHRPAYSKVAAITLGPMVLGGITSSDDVIQADPSKVAQWVMPAEGLGVAADDGDDEADDAPVRLVAVGANRNYSLVPLNRLVKQNYSVYFNVTG